MEGKPKAEAPGEGLGAAVAGVGWFWEGEGGLASEPLELEGEGGGWYWGLPEERDEGASRAPEAPVLEPVPGCGWRGPCPPHWSPNGFPYMGKPSILSGGWKGL